MITSAISLVVATLALTAFDISSTYQRLVRDTTLLADVIGSNSTDVLLFNDAQGAADTVRAVAANDDVVEARIWRKEGSLLAEFQRPQGAPAPAPWRSAEADRVRAHDAWHDLRGGALFVSRQVLTTENSSAW